MTYPNIKLTPEQIESLRKYPAFKGAELPFIIRVDPTTLASSYCLRKVELMNLLGMRTKKPNHIPEYGSAIHLAVANRRRGMKISKCEQSAFQYFSESGADAEMDWRNEGHMINVLNRYFEEYREDNFQPMKVEIDGVTSYCVEQQFALELVDCGDIVFLLVGAIDAVGKYHAPVEICDIKCTAAKRPSIFLSKYRYSHQMMLYSYAVKQLGFCDYYPPAFIDGIFLNDGSPFARFERSPAYDFTDEAIAATVEWARRQCLALLGELMDVCVSPINPNKIVSEFLRNPSCCELFNGCDFTDLCWGNETMQMLARQRYVQRVYDPRTFGTRGDEV